MNKPIVLTGPLYYRGWHVNVVRSHYINTDRIALMLIDADDGLPITTCTVNIPEVFVEKDQLIIKDWSENEGILKWLQEHNIVGPRLRSIPTGHVEADLCELLITEPIMP